MIEDAAESALELRCNKILLVDDAPENLRILSECLRDKYTIMFAKSGPDALRLALRQTPPDLILLDVVMPEMNGRDLARNVTTFQPGLKCLFMSGYTADVIAHNGMLHKGVHFIQKPFTLRELGTHVRSALDS